MADEDPDVEALSDEEFDAFVEKLIAEETAAPETTSMDPEAVAVHDAWTWVIQNYPEVAKRAVAEVKVRQYQSVVQALLAERDAEREEGIRGRT